ncbi:putative S-adenosylmethionine-dependent methyltransferase of the seven beta-strand family [Trichophaea hybrida]|nr:putative S-adenosylmethionine-dependent methyltransferase of the seven beta-strand family [Trichophaea hybrida]
MTTESALNSDLEHLNPSELGTKEHWEQAYHNEIQNFLENPNDEGVIWFEESDAEGRILRYLNTLPLSPSTTSFLDVGTGNGHLLFELLEDGYTGAMIGIDYSPASVTLAKTVAKGRGVEGSTQFEVVDVIKDDLASAAWVPDAGFEVVLDKGTFDAISLSDETLPDGRRIVECYPGKVAGVLKKGGWLIVTSCNWTEEELKRRIEVRCEELKWFGRVEYSNFTFGGQKGQTICTICFQKL